MWIADHWKDYEVLDTSSGEKLERWGDYILVRPDPQVIWKTPHDHKGWKQKNGHYHRSAKGGGEWEFFHLPDEWAIHYTLPFQKEACGKTDPLTFHLKPFSFKHTGLFPEQAVNWDWFSGLIHEAGHPVKVLNLLISRKVALVYRFLVYLFCLFACGCLEGLCHAGNALQLCGQQDGGGLAVSYLFESFQAL